MGMLVANLVIHILCTIVWIVDVFICEKKSDKIVYSIGSVLWGLCSALDIVRLVLLA